MGGLVCGQKPWDPLERTIGEDTKVWALDVSVILPPLGQ